MDFFHKTATVQPAPTDFSQFFIAKDAADKDFRAGKALSKKESASIDELKEAQSFFGSARDKYKEMKDMKADEAMRVRPEKRLAKLKGEGKYSDKSLDTRIATLSASR